MHRRSHFLHIVLLTVVASVCVLPGCVTPEGKSMLNRMFPADPDDSFFGDEARAIDRRLSTSAPQVDLNK